jgi:hypothetical protein
MSSKPYFTSPDLDAYMIMRVSDGLRQRGHAPIADHDILRGLRAIQDADVQLGSTSDPVSVFLDLTDGLLTPWSIAMARRDVADITAALEGYNEGQSQVP